MKGMLHRLFKEQSIPLENVNKLRKLGNVVSGNGTVDYVIELSGKDGDMEYYNYSLVGTDVEEVGEGYFVLNDVEVRDSDSSKKNYYKGKSFDYSMEYEKPLNSLEFFYEMVYGRAGDMFLKPPYSNYLGFDSEGGEQYDYYTIERDYDEGYMNARVPTLKTNRLFDPLYYTQHMMMNDMSDRISTAFHPNAEVREQSGYGTREKQRDAIFNGLKSWNEQMIEDLNGVKRSIDMELGDRKFEAETFEAERYKPTPKEIRFLVRNLRAVWIKYERGIYDEDEVIDKTERILYHTGVMQEEYRAEEFGAEESINPKDYIQVWILDEWGNSDSPIYLNTYDLRFGERGSTYFKALREALDKGVKRGDYEGYKIRKILPSPATHDWADWLSYDRAYNDSYSYNVYIYGEKFLRGDADFPIVENKYTIEEGDKSFHVVSKIFEKPQKKTTEPMDGLGSLFGAEGFEAKGYRNPYAFRKPKLVDTDKYEGHTKGSWDRLSEYCPVGQIDRSLIADAPMLLEEVKDGNRIKEYIYQFAQYPSIKKIHLDDLIAFIEEDDERFGAENYITDNCIQCGRFNEYKCDECDLSLCENCALTPDEVSVFSNDSGYVSETRNELNRKYEELCKGCVDELTEYYKDDSYDAETFEAKGIDTFTEPFAELKSGSILNKAILLGSLGAGAMIGLKLRK